MTCNNVECSREYCLYHGNAHPMSETCESYDLRNEINEMYMHVM